MHRRRPDRLLLPLRRILPIRMNRAAEIPTVLPAERTETAHREAGTADRVRVRTEETAPVRKDVRMRARIDADRRTGIPEQGTGTARERRFRARVRQGIRVLQRTAAAAMLPEEAASAMTADRVLHLLPIPESTPRVPAEETVRRKEKENG